MKNILKRKSKHLTLICLFIFSTISCTANLKFNSYEKKIIYHVFEHPDDQETLTLSLKLPEAKKNETLELHTRGMHLGIKPQVTDLKCNGEIIHPKQMLLVRPADKQ